MHDFLFRLAVVFSTYWEEVKPDLIDLGLKPIFIGAQVF